MSGLFHSRKFYLAVYGLLQTLILHYLAIPQDIIIALDAVVAIVIAGIAYEDGQAKRGGLLTAPSSPFRDRVYGADELP